MVGQQSYEDRDMVSCECEHLSSFTVVMDHFDMARASAYAVSLEVVSYVGVTIGLALLLISMFLFCCLRNLHSNTNSIHINLVFTMIAAALIYIAGINRTQPKVAVCLT